MLHRFAAAERALGHAERLGASDVRLAECRADVLEARGEVGAALTLRLDGLGPSAGSAPQARIACSELLLGDYVGAEARFAAAIGGYRAPSPFPPATMLFNWGHAWQHRGEQDRASEAYRAVLVYLPNHVRAVRSLAAALSSGDDRTALEAARRAVESNPADPISVGMLGLIGRRAGEQGHRAMLIRANRIFEARMAEYPEAWAAHAAEFWRAEGDHPEHEARATYVVASIGQAQSRPDSERSLPPPGWTLAFLDASHTPHDHR